MRVLIDECLPRQLRSWLSTLQPGWTVTTVQAAPAAAQRGPRGDRAKKDGAASGDGKASAAAPASAASPTTAPTTKNGESKSVTPASAASADVPKKPWSELTDVEKAERKKQREANGEAPRGAPRQ